MVSISINKAKQRYNGMPKITNEMSTINDDKGLLLRKQIRTPNTWQWPELHKIAFNFRQIWCLDQARNKRYFTPKLNLEQMPASCKI